MKENKFIIVSTGYNIEEYIQKCLDLVFCQTYKNYQMVFIDDGSTDKTVDIVKQTKCILIQEQHSGSALKNTLIGLKEVKPSPEDIIVLLDGDDWFAHKNVLKYLNEVYQDDNIWVTYGQFEPLDKAYSDFCQQIENTRTLRQDPWVTSHLKTFKYHLFKRIKLNDFVYQNKIVVAAPDQAIMLPLLEMAGLKRIKFISDVLYIYNNLNPNNEMKIRGQEQLDIAAYIRTLSPYEELP